MKTDFTVKITNDNVEMDGSGNPSEIINGLAIALNDWIVLTTPDKEDYKYIKDLTIKMFEALSYEEAKEALDAHRKENEL